MSTDSDNIFAIGVQRDDLGLFHVLAEFGGETVFETRAEALAAMDEDSEAFERCRVDHVIEILRTQLAAAMDESCVACGQPWGVEPASGEELPIIRGALDAQEKVERRAFSLAAALGDAERLCAKAWRHFENSSLLSDHNGRTGCAQMDDAGSTMDEAAAAAYGWRRLLAAGHAGEDPENG